MTRFNHTMVGVVTLWLITACSNSEGNGSSSDSGAGGAAGSAAAGATGEGADGGGGVGGDGAVGGPSNAVLITSSVDAFWQTVQVTSEAALDTHIMLGTFDDGRSTSYIEQVLADSTARDHCTVAGVGYDMVSASKVEAIHDADIPVWVSEHKAGNYFWEASYQTPAPNDLSYAIETWQLIHKAITQVGVTAYNAWHMVLDASGERKIAASQWAQDSLLVIDGDKLVATPAYYVFRHLSRFVEPGAKVVTVSRGDAVAFRNPDDSLVVVLYNEDEATQLTVDVGGRLWRFSAPEHSFATLVEPS